MKPKPTFPSKFVIPKSMVPTAPPIPDLSNQSRERSGRLLSRLLKHKQLHRWAKKLFPKMHHDTIESVASTANGRIDLALRSYRVECVSKFMISERISVGDYRSFLAFAHRVTRYAAYEAYRLQTSDRLVTNSETIEIAKKEHSFDERALDFDELDFPSLSESALRHAKETLDNKCFSALMYRIKGLSYAEIGKQIGGNRNSASALTRMACRSIGDFLEGTLSPKALASFIVVETKRNPSFTKTNELGFSVCEPGLRLAEIVVAHQHAARQNRAKQITL